MHLKKLYIIYYLIYFLEKKSVWKLDFFVKTTVLMGSHMNIRSDDWYDMKWLDVGLLFVPEINKVGCYERY